MQFRDRHKFIEHTQSSTKFRDPPTGDLPQLLMPFPSPTICLITRSLADDKTNF